MDTRYVAVNESVPTNHHYVLCYEPNAPFSFGTSTIRISFRGIASACVDVSLSLGEHSEAFHTELATWLRKHPETKLAFQPGTFQIKMGKEKLTGLYSIAGACFCK